MGKTILNRAYILYGTNMLKELDSIRVEPFIHQLRSFENLIKCGRETQFGNEHKFEKISDISTYQKLVPIREYDQFVPYIDAIKRGEKNILWNQPVKWFAKSSGTSSDKSKFIPITEDSLENNHYGATKRMLSSYIAAHPDSKIFAGKALTLGGSVKPDVLPNGADSKILSGDLSAILLTNTPAWVEYFRIPKRDVALTDDFDKKVEAICNIASKADVTNFSGVPSWNLLLLNKLMEFTGKGNIGEIWPNLELFMHGGIGFDPYREIYKKIIPLPNMRYLENYNASEGFFAFQDDLNDSGMLLCLNSGVFYEFIPMSEYEKVISGEIKEIPTIESVQLGVKYAMIISTVGGLWRYSIGDCVEFVSLFPHKIKIVGRTKLFINAFGEELMVGNAEKALTKACKEHNCTVADFTVAPHFMQLSDSGQSAKGYHKWAIEFITPPSDIDKFTSDLDYAITQQNSDYEAKRKNNYTMEQLKLTVLKEGTFVKWMESRNKKGGQNKVPRLYSDSKFFDELEQVSLKMNI